ncbi:VWA domain-containing protein [Microbacterium phyllosphaerae]|uniref:VWA domain-containing protein n=1 Tax=Microbacterium phyllosphaerae TaxID=124798 RepID=UPI003D655F3C
MTALVLVIGSAVVGMGGASASASTTTAPSPDSTTVSEGGETDAAVGADDASVAPETDQTGSVALPPLPGTDATEPLAALPTDLGISPMAVPVPPAGSAVITVKVGGDRLADGTVKGLAGVRLALHAPGTATTSVAGGTPVQGVAGTRHPTAWSWTGCVSDADGDCSFIVPVRAGTISITGAPQDTRFWIVQESAPAGWYSNPTMRVGGLGATPDYSWQYRFRTDTELRAGVVYSSTAPMPWTDPAVSADPDRFFFRNRGDSNVEGSYSSNVTRTTGIWSQSRTNPVFPASCDIDIALIGDTSASLGLDGIAEMKATMTAFVDAFRGTQTRMAAFSFSTDTPGLQASNHPALLPVTTAAQASAFTAQYANWFPAGGTNWDAGFAVAANAAPHYDLAILLTDGNPTARRGNTQSAATAFNSLGDVDAGVFSANQLKAEGTRVIALGVGPALTTTSESNLRAVSGQTLNSDYYRAANFADATAALRALAGANCQGTLGVQKMIVPSGGTIADATPAPAGWRFDATSVSTAVAVNAPATQVTAAGADGKVDFGLTFPSTPSTGSVQVLETQQAGYSLVPVGAGAAARNATCVNVETGAAVAVTNAGTTAQPGFRVDALKNQRIECRIYNRAPAPGNLVVEKASTPPSGATVTPGQSISYTLTFRNTGGLPVAVDQEDVLTGVRDDADLFGLITVQPPLSVVLNPAGDRLRVTGTLPAGATATLTYSVRVKNPQTASGDHVLRNAVVPTGQQPPQTCTPPAPCTVHPVVVTLAWNKVDLAGDRLSGAEWTLTPFSAPGVLDPSKTVTVVDCIAANAAACTGRDVDPAAGQFLVSSLTPGSYRLIETKAPAGYLLLEDPIDIAVLANVVFGDIENEQVSVPGIPLTGGLGSLGFAVAAGGLGVLAAGGAWLKRRRMLSR